MKRKSITKEHKRDGIGLIQKPRGRKRIGPPFPTKSNTKSHESISKTYSKEKNGGERHMGGGLEEQAIHGRDTKATLT